MAAASDIRQKPASGNPPTNYLAQASAFIRMLDLQPIGHVHPRIARNIFVDDNLSLYRVGLPCKPFLEPSSFAFPQLSSPALSKHLIDPSSAATGAWLGGSSTGLAVPTHALSLFPTYPSRPDLKDIPNGLSSLTVLP